MILDRIASLFTHKRESTTYANPSSWFVDWILGGEKTSAGIRVTAQSALTYAAVWRAVSKISQDVAVLPVSIRKRLDKGGKDDAKEHPSYFILKHKPNAYMTSPVFRQTLQADALLHGSGYAFIERQNNGDIVSLIPLPAQYTVPKYVEGTWYYDCDLDGTIRRFSEDEILHIKGLSPNGITPYSVFDKARESLGLGLAARKYGATYFRNNARPSLVLEHPGRLSAEAKEKLRAAWQTKFSGENSFEVAVAEEGMKATPLSISNTDAQFIETRKFEIREIANWFGLPPHFLGDDSKTAYASLEQENQSYLDGCLNSWLVMWESELFDKLLSEKEKKEESHVIEFTRQALVRANLDARGKYYAVAVNNRWMNPNEVRELENLNPYEGGDEFIVPLNMGNPGGDPNAKPKGDMPMDDEKMPEDMPSNDRFKPVIADAVKRMVKRISFHARNAKAEKFMDFVSAFRNEHRAVLIDILLPAVGLVTQGDTPVIHERAACFASDFLDTIYDELLALADSCKMNELQSRVSACMDAHEQFSIDTITKTILEKQ